MWQSRTSGSHTQKGKSHLQDPLHRLHWVLMGKVRVGEGEEWVFLGDAGLEEGSKLLWEAHKAQLRYFPTEQMPQTTGGRAELCTFRARWRPAAKEGAKENNPIVIGDAGNGSGLTILRQFHQKSPTSTQSCSRLIKDIRQFGCHGKVRQDHLGAWPLKPRNTRRQRLGQDNTQHID